MTKLNYKINLLILTALVFVFSCTSGEKKSDNDRKDSLDFTNHTGAKHTDFITTLENPVLEKRNVIYTPVFHYAWNKIEENLKSEILVNKINSRDFRILLLSKSHLNALGDTEYVVKTEMNDKEITAKAFFNKTLPFQTKLQSLEELILFGKSKVSAFGMHFFDSNFFKIIQILYYKDENSFILKLSPKDKQNEIILVKGLHNYKTLSDALKLTSKLVQKGKTESLSPKNRWKYEIGEEDIIAIPVVKFDLEANYKSLEGQNFLTKDKKFHFIKEAYQQTRFCLNEKGAVVKIVAIADVDSAGEPPSEKPSKKMIFDKKFLIIIKKTDKTNPYFMMQVSNTELLTKK